MYIGLGAAIKGAIPWTAIHDYASRHGIDDADDFVDFLSLIRAMETAEYRIEREKQPGPAGKGRDKRK